MYNVAGGDGSPEEPAGTFFGLTQAPYSYRFFGSKLVKFPPEKVAEIHDGCALALPHSYDRGDANEAAEIKAGLARGIDGFQVNAPDVAAAATGQPVATRIRFAGAGQVCLENARNGNGLPYKRLSVGRSLPLLTLRFGCAELPAGTPRRTSVRFAGDASALGSTARRPARTLRSAAARTASRPPALNIAHRGASGHAPEHTFPSYDLALRFGADYIEQDLQETADGVLVVLHDETLDRTARGPAANCTGRVADKTLAQIKTCDVGSWFNDANLDAARPEYVGLRIPTLEEVFRRYGKRANYYIETKSPESADRMEEKLLALLDRYGLRAPAVDHRQVLIQSFSPASLLKIHAQLDPELPLIQLLYGGPSLANQAALDVIKSYAVGIGPAAASVDRALVDAAHARGLGVHPYTVNEPAEMRALLGAGVDGMFTNFPDRLEALLRHRQDK
jgi:glycerophosphoryl diester phosphodiesterase